MGSRENAEWASYRYRMRHMEWRILFGCSSVMLIALCLLSFVIIFIRKVL